MAKRKKAHAPRHEFALEFILLCILGLVVAVAMLPLVQFETLRALDRKVSDLLMQQLARAAINNTDASAPRFVFIDIDEQTCEEWALAANMSCTKGWATPRDRLAALLETLAAASAVAQQRPRLL